MPEKLFAQMSVGVLWSRRLVLQAVIQNLNEHIGLDEALSPGIPLGQNLFLLELVESLSFLNAGFYRG